jgi:hypothetical protein
VEKRAQHGERTRKTGKHHDDGDDQPDVICFPNGTDCAGDGRALTIRGRTAREQIPQTAAVVGAAQ